MKEIRTKRVKTKRTGMYSHPGSLLTELVAVEALIICHWVINLVLG